MTRRPVRSRGYAMILMLTISLVMSVISIALVNATTTDLNGARQLLGRSEARMLATSGLEEFSGRFAADPKFFTPLLDTSEGTVVDHPAFTPTNQVKSPTEKWARFDGSAVVPCADAGSLAGSEFNKDCFTITATVERTIREGNGVFASSDIVRAVLVDVTSRVSCAGLENRCVYARVQQRIRPQQFYNSLLYYQYATLDPLLYPDPTTGDPEPADGLTVQQAQVDCADRYAYALLAQGIPAREPFCVSVAFTSGDIIRGPVTTLDNYIVTCGTPEFQDTVRVSGGYITASGAPRAYATSLELAEKVLASEKWPTSCGKPAPSATGDTPPPAVFRKGASLSVDPTFELPSPATIERAESISQFTFRQADPTKPVEVTFSTREAEKTPTGEGQPPVTTITVTNTDRGATYTADLPSPANEVIVIRSATVASPSPDLPAPVQVRGKIAGKVSLFAEKDIKIVGDLLYHSGQNGSNLQDILGLIAGEDLILATPTSTPTASGRAGSNLTVAAIATSLGGSIYTQDWDTPASASGVTWTPGTLTWFGALSSMYQGVFGGYDNTTGKFVSGYKKNFEFDARAALGVLSPPYVASPEKTSWTRLASLEVPPER